MLRYKNFFLEETISDLQNQNKGLNEDLNKLKKAKLFLINGLPNQPGGGDGEKLAGFS